MKNTGSSLKREVKNHSIKTNLKGVKNQVRATKKLKKVFGAIRRHVHDRRLTICNAIFAAFTASIWSI
jgi:hypothetical protein